MVDFLRAILKSLLTLKNYLPKNPEHNQDFFLNMRKAVKLCDKGNITLELV